MRFTKRDLSRLLFKNVSPLKLILHGICIGICLLPAIATLVVGLIVFVTSPSDNITTPSQCTILSKLQCVTTSLINTEQLEETSVTIECTYTVSFVIVPSSSNQQTIHASTIPFPRTSTYSNYTLNQQVLCYYDQNNPKNVSFEKTNLVHFYTIVGLGVIGVGGCLLFLVLVSMTIFFTNLCRFCVGHSHVRSQRKRRLRRNLLSILIPRSSIASTKEGVSVMNSESDYDDDYQTDSGVDRIGSSTREILHYGTIDAKDEGNGYYYSNANKKQARFNNFGQSGSSNGSSGNTFYVHVTSSTRVKKNKGGVLIDERHFYQHSDDEEHDERTDSSVEDIAVEIIGSLNKVSSYPAHNL